MAELGSDRYQLGRQDGDDRDHPADDDPGFRRIGACGGDPRHEEP
jgi:hypothetical protein